MGLLGDWLGSKRMADPVRGTAQVVAASGPPDHSTRANCALTLVIQAPGVPATPIQHSAVAPAKRWPYPGRTLPVTVDRADPERLKIHWEEVPETGQVAWQQAQGMADAMSGGTPAGVPDPMPGTAGTQHITINAPGGELDDATRARLAAMGVDVDAVVQQARALQQSVRGGASAQAQGATPEPRTPDQPVQPLAGSGLPGQPMPAGSPAKPGHAGGGDLSEKLARLAQLHQSGALAADEFAAAKKRLLEGS